MSTTSQIRALQGHHAHDVPVGKGEPTRMWAADIVTVNPDGTVDCQPISSRATKTRVPVPAWYHPATSDRVLVADLNGDPRLPIVLAPLSTLTPTVAAKPALTYSRASETAAVTQLRQALVTLGLVTDSTTP